MPNRIQPKIRCVGHFIHNSSKRIFFSIQIHSFSIFFSFCFALISIDSTITSIVICRWWKRNYFIISIYINRCNHHNPCIRKKFFFPFYSFYSDFKQIKSDFRKFKETSRSLCMCGRKRGWKKPISQCLWLIFFHIT